MCHSTKTTLMANIVKRRSNSSSQVTSLPFKHPVTPSSGSAIPCTESTSCQFPPIKTLVIDITYSTLTSSTGLKTRHFGTIISELTSAIRVHASHNSRLNGVSLEFTGELTDDGFSVTECLGGSMGLSESELGLRYQVSTPLDLRAS